MSASDPTLHHPLRRRGQAFTLIEMLLVVSIICVLIAMLLPALGVSRDSAERSKCESNIRLLLTAYQNYSRENKRQLVGADTSNPWDWLRTSSNTPTSITQGKLWSYVGAMDAYRCPDQVYPNYLNSYSINAQLNGEQKFAGNVGVGANWQKKHITSDMKLEKQLVFLEEDDNRGWNINSFMLGLGQGQFIDLIAANHMKGDNLGFLDGHVEAWQWKDPETYIRPKPWTPGQMPQDPGNLDWDRLKPVFQSWAQ